MDWVVQHDMLINGQHVVEVPILVPDVPDTITDAEQIKSALTRAGLAPADYGRLWANHRVSPMSALPTPVGRGEARKVVPWIRLATADEAKVQIHLRLTPTLAAQIRQVAEHRRESVNTLITRVLERVVADDGAATTPSPC